MYRAQQPREGERRRGRRRRGAVSAEGRRKKKRTRFLPALRDPSCDPSPSGDFLSPQGEKKRLPTWGERTR
ncbi:hypothetical protein BHM03_00019441 [Ensete ventricosum]|nr:hypothetical protein BHM03_00019441 [Ensete ventricosum]